MSICTLLPVGNPMFAAFAIVTSPVEMKLMKDKAVVKTTAFDKRWNLVSIFDEFKGYFDKEYTLILDYSCSWCFNFLFSLVKTYQCAHCSLQFQEKLCYSCQTLGEGILQQQPITGQC